MDKTKREYYKFLRNGKWATGFAVDTARYVNGNVLCVSEDGRDSQGFGWTHDYMDKINKIVAGRYWGVPLSKCELYNRIFIKVKL